MMREQLIEQLRQLPFFKGLSNEALADLSLTAVWRTYHAGEIIFLEGETAVGLHYLASGWIKINKSSVEGREQTLRFFGPGETFNEIAAFSRRPNNATAVALEPAGVWLLPRQGITNLLRQQPDLAQNIIESMAQRVVDLVNLITDLSLRSVSGRLARLILDEAKDDILLRPRWQTQAELAARLGTVPDVVQRALRGLEVNGTIEVERQEIRIRNRPALEKLAA